MKRSNRVVILVGVLLAILAFVAIVILLNSRPAANPTAEPTTTTVLVAIAEIPPDTDVTEDLVEEREVEPEAVLEGALVDPSQLGGRTTVVSIAEGSQVTESAFGGDPTLEADLEAQLLPGEKAISLQLDPVTGLNFLLRQGDVVDVLLTFDFEPASIEASASGTGIVRSVKTVLQMKRVLYASASNIPPPPVVDEEGNEVPPTETQAIGSIVVVIAGSDADAELIRFAQRDAAENGRISMTLRRTDDEAIEETVGVTLLEVVETYGVVVPGLVEGIDSAAGPAE